MTETAAYYDRYWTPEGFQPPRNRNSFLDASIARFSHPGTKVADLGCGDARTLGDRFVQGGAEYVGIDISRPAVAAATARGLDVREVADITQTALCDDSFDAVFMIEVLEHLFDPLAAVVEAKRILRPGGEMRVTVPNSAVWPRRLELMFRGRPNAMGDGLSRTEPWRDPHIRAFTLASLHALLLRAGFLQITIGGTEPTTPIKSPGPWLVRKRPTVFARRCTATAVK